MADYDYNGLKGWDVVATLVAAVAASLTQLGDVDIEEFESSSSCDNAEMSRTAQDQRGGHSKLIGEHQGESPGIAGSTD